MILYFGCRSKKVDFIFQDEIEKYANNNVINELKLACSREQKQKLYVQNLMEKNSKSI